MSDLYLCDLRKRKFTEFSDCDYIITFSILYHHQTRDLHQMYVHVSFLSHDDDDWDWWVATFKFHHNYHFAINNTIMIYLNTRTAAHTQNKQNDDDNSSTTNKWK